MFLNNYSKLQKRESLLIILLLVLSFLGRIPVILSLGDIEIENEWTILLNNLLNHSTLASTRFGEFLLPNLWMPPLYAYYLYFFTFFNFEYQNFILLILFSQSVLASISVLIFYKINKFFFSNKISYYSSLIFSFFPLFIYASGQISSISLTIFLSMFFYYYFFKVKKYKKKIHIFFLGFVAGLLILVSREFTAIVVLTSLYLFLFCKISYKKITLILLITIITISPYLVRNYLIFDKFIIHAGFGYNLWKGNNPKSKVQGFETADKNLKYNIDKIPKDKFYRINENKIYMNEAINNIKNDPKRYLVLYIKKATSFFFIDSESSYPNYYNPIHYIPILVLAFTSLIGIFLSNKKSSDFNYLLLIFSFYLFTFSIFSILPRYKIYIIPFQIIFSNIFITHVIKKYIDRNSVKD